MLIAMHACCFLQVEPKGDRVLVKIAEQEQKTRGGILLPISAQSRPTSGAWPSCSRCSRPCRRLAAVAAAVGAAQALLGTAAVAAWCWHLLEAFCMWQLHAAAAVPASRWLYSLAGMSQCIACSASLAAAAGVPPASGCNVQASMSIMCLPAYLCCAVLCVACVVLQVTC